jgi:antitoxin component of MazEF toxin-antitoxin module
VKLFLKDSMKKRAFDAKIRKVGNSHIVTVPANIIKKFKLKPNKFLTITIEDEE